MRVARYLAVTLWFLAGLVLAARPAAAQPDAAAAGAAVRSEDREAHAILAVIQNESAAFWDKDFDRWAACWAHGPYVRIMGWWEAGGISVTEGWEAVSRGMRRLMQENPAPNPTAALVRRENLNLRIVGDMALVTFDQYGLDTGDARMDMPGLSRETRVLEKQEGQWKLVYVGWLLDGRERAE